MPDESLLNCPSVEAPLGTELREGFVVLEFAVLPDGSVDNVHVLERGGDPRWVDAAVATLSRWKFRPTEHPVQKTQRFTFQLGDYGTRP